MSGVLTRVSTVRRPVSDPRRRVRRTSVEVVPLETRALLSTMPMISESVRPQVLWPPNGRLVPVQVTGTVSDSIATVRSVQYNVQDSESGSQIAAGPVALHDGRYSFRIRLEARRAGQDFNGRQYTVNIIASDTQNNTTSHSALVTVPHDQGRRGGGSGAGRLLNGPGGSVGRGFRSGGFNRGAGNRLHLGGPGEGQQNSISVPGNNDTVTQNITNNQSNTYNISNSFNTSVSGPAVSVSNPARSPVSMGSGGGQDDQGDHGGGPGNGNGNGHGQGHGNGGSGDQGGGQGNGHGHDKHGGD